MRPVSGDPREELAAVLGDLRSGGSFATRRTAPVGDLAIEVNGVGPLRYPVTATQAKQLRLVARPAKYGHGERTVLDPRVRDTWEVPRSRVKVDKRRWNRTLGPLLKTIGEDLGLPATSTLTVELHSMLVYEPGQFFAPHQDSEKNDEMIGSLIVLLPSNCAGGDLVISHRDESVRYQGSASSLTLVAFYADTRHEVAPVERGYRVALTYNLMLAGDTTDTRGDGAALAATAAALLEQHFTHTPQPRWRNNQQALEPPDRLVFLLDHQYTQRGLRWSQLKGDDAARADVLRVAADHAACDVALAHAEIHETYDCEADTTPWRGRRYADWEDEPDDEDHDNVALGELLDSSVAISPAAKSPISFDGEVTDAELATVTPSVELAPHTAEYTGFMGNWGNTMDRWYRRAAIVIWPRARAFAVQAKGDPLAALHSLLGSTTRDAGGTPARADDVSTMLRFWPDAVRRGDQQTLLSPALRLAWQLNDADRGTRLVEHFTIEAVTPADAAVMLALAEQHGLGWLDQRITTWMSRRPPHGSTGRTRNSWAESLPELCANLRNDGHAPEDLRAGSARLVVNHVGDWLKSALGHAAAVTTPSQRQAVQHDLGAAILAVLRAVAIAEDAELHDEIIDALCDPALQTAATRCVLQAAAVLPPDELPEIGVITMARHGAATLEAELALRERAGDDWSITDFESGTCCKDCATLAGFLTDTARQQLTWPLAKPRRQHIHQRIKEAELPVTHRTMRQGSPHKLILTKTADLHTRAADLRQATRASLQSLQQLLAEVVT